MAEIRLDYDRSIVVQETGFWCGPGATQIVLDALGIKVAEAELAREIGTHEGGTNTIEWLVDRSLNKRVPHAGYQVVWMPRDPPTEEQAERLWGHLTRSVSAGFGVPMNWWVAGNNTPIGVKGSVSPGYSRTYTTKHYVAAMGFADGPDALGVPGGRAVWVADSANFGGIQGFWLSFWQCATLIPPMGYAWASASPALPAAAAPVAADPLDVLAKAMSPTQVGRERLGELLPYVIECLQRCGCDNVQRIAMWCAQIGHESAGLRYMREIADGSAYEGRADLGNTQPGDGVRFAGRSPIQLTGRSNYERVSRWSHELGYTDSPTAFLDQPELLETPRYGFLGVAWYWTVARPQINEMSDRSDLEGVTRAINGGLNGLQDRRQRWDRCNALGDRLMALVEFQELTPPPEPAPVPVAPVLPPAASLPQEVDVSTLTAAEQLEMLGLLRTLASDRYSSISPFRHLGAEESEAVTLPQRLAFIDANLHVVMTMLLASIGDTQHLRLLAEVVAAEGDARFADRAHDARLARTVLAWAEASGAFESAQAQEPVWACEITGADCVGGGTGRCSVTGSGVCARGYGLTMG